MRHFSRQRLLSVSFTKISPCVVLVIIFFLALVPLPTFAQRGGAHFGGGGHFSRGGGMAGHPGSSSHLSSPHLPSPYLTYDPRRTASSSFFTSSSFAPNFRSGAFVRRRSHFLGRGRGFNRNTFASGFYGWGWWGPDCEPYWAWDWECGLMPDGWSNYSDAEFSEVEPRPVVVFYLRDGTGLGATDYWRVDNTLHLKTTYGADKTFAMDQVDMQRTVDENAARGVYFTLGTMPSVVIGGPVPVPDSHPPVCAPASTQSASAAASAQGERSATSLLGVSGTPSESGLRIDSVRAGSPAARLGVRSGDVVLQVDCQQVHSGQDIASAIAVNTTGAVWVSYMIKGAWLSAGQISVR